jgi:hypothetical protein
MMENLQRDKEILEPQQKGFSSCLKGLLASLEEKETTGPSSSKQSSV